MSVLGELLRKIVDHPKEYAEVYQLAVRGMVENQELLEKMGRLRDERDALQEKVKELEKRRQLDEQLIEEEGILFRRKPGGGIEEFPYCQPCWVNDNRLEQLMVPRSETSVYLCRQCKKAVDRHDLHDAREAVMERLQEADAS